MTEGGLAATGSSTTSRCKSLTSWLSRFARANAKPMRGFLFHYFGRGEWRRRDFDMLDESMLPSLARLSSVREGEAILGQMTLPRLPSLLSLLRLPFLLRLLFFLRFRPYEFRAANPLRGRLLFFLQIVNIFRGSLPLNVGQSTKLSQGDSLWILLKNAPDVVEYFPGREFGTWRDSGFVFSLRHRPRQLRTLRHAHVLPILYNVHGNSRHDHDRSFIAASPKHMPGNYER